MKGKYKIIYNTFNNSLAQIISNPNSYKLVDISNKKIKLIHTGSFSDCYNYYKAITEDLISDEQTLVKSDKKLNLEIQKIADFIKKTITSKDSTVYYTHHLDNVTFYLHGKDCFTEKEIIVIEKYMSEIGLKKEERFSKKNPYFNSFYFLQKSLLVNKK